MHQRGGGVFWQEGHVPQGGQASEEVGGEEGPGMPPDGAEGRTCQVRGAVGGCRGGFLESGAGQKRKGYRKYLERRRKDKFSEGGVPAGLPLAVSRGRLGNVCSYLKMRSEDIGWP